MTDSVETEYVRADNGTFAEHQHSAPEPSAELKAESRIPLIGDWARYTEEWDVSNVRPGGPDAPVEYVIFYDGPYTGQIMPTQDDGDPLPAGRAPTQNYWDRRDEILRDDAEKSAAGAEATAAALVEPERVSPDGYLRRLVDAGMDERVARITTGALMTANMNRDILAAGRESLERGHEMPAAMFVLAHSAVETLPKAVLDAGTDLSAADAAFLQAKRRLSSVGQMFHMMSPSGQEPTFTKVEAMVDEAREVLTVRI